MNIGGFLKIFKNSPRNYETLLQIFMGLGGKQIKICNF